MKSLIRFLATSASARSRAKAIQAVKALKNSVKKVTCHQLADRMSSWQLTTSINRLEQNQAKNAKSKEKTAVPAAIALMIKLPDNAFAKTRVESRPTSIPKKFVSSVYPTFASVQSDIPE